MLVSTALSALAPATQGGGGAGGGSVGSPQAWGASSRCQRSERGECLVVSASRLPYADVDAEHTSLHPRDAWREMARDGPRWPEMPRDYPRLPETARDDPRCPARNRTPAPAVSHEFNVMTLSSIPAPRIPSSRYATADTRDYAIAVRRHSRDTCSLATLPRDSPHLPMARRTSMTRTSMTRPLTPPRPLTRPRPARSCPSFPRSCTTGCGPPTCRAPPLSSPSAPPPACHSLPRRRPHGPAICPCRCWAARRRREPPAAWGGCVPGLTPVRLAHCWTS